MNNKVEIKKIVLIRGTTYTNAFGHVVKNPLSFKISHNNKLVMVIAVTKKILKNKLFFNMFIKDKYLNMFPLFYTLNNKETLFSAEDLKIIMIDNLKLIDNFIEELKVNKLLK